MYLKKVLAENPGLPCFCFGHSTGGGIILKVTSVVLTSPSVLLHISFLLYVLIVLVLGRLHLIQR
jgi:alpha-beta hydrolase superfamily lysophospholipase